MEILTATRNHSSNTPTSHVLPDTFFFETAKELFNDLILFGRVRLDELLLQPIVSTGLPKAPMLLQRQTHSHCPKFQQSFSTTNCVRRSGARFRGGGSNRINSTADSVTDGLAGLVGCLGLTPRGSSEIREDAHLNSSTGSLNFSFHRYRNPHKLLLLGINNHAPHRPRVCQFHLA